MTTNPGQTEYTGSPPPLTVEPLTHTAGLRVWVDDVEHFPTAVSTLLAAANTMEITPSVILFDLCENVWNLILLGEH